MAAGGAREGDGVLFLSFFMFLDYGSVVYSGFVYGACDTESDVVETILSRSVIR